MRQIVILLSNNQIKISSIDKQDFSSISADISNEVMQHNKILDQNVLSGIIKELLTKMGINPRNTGLVFAMESADVFLRFVTVPKQTENIDEQIINEIRTKFTELSLENVYYGYEKIAPFVYQFVAVEKSILESLLHVAETLGMTLNAVVPWVSALPKYVNTNEPGIFIVGEGEFETVALSELGGIFFSDKYSPDGRKFDLEKTVKDLSVYRREKPIKNIYTLNYSVPELSNGYTVTKLEFNIPSETDISSYERNLLVHFILDAGTDLDECRVNLLNVLPLPSVQRKPMAISKIGVMAGVGVSVSLFLLVITGVLKFGTHDNSKLADSSNTSDTAVLSTQDTTIPTPTPVPTPIEVVLNRSDLKIKVENGSGINGMAAKTKSKLEELKYTVTEIGTADEITTKTILRYKKDKLGFEKLLKEDLKDDYGEIIVEDTLSLSASEDLLLIIGSGIKQ